MLKTCLLGLGLAAVAAVVPPGEEKKPKTKVLEAGAKVLQKVGDDSTGFRLSNSA